jgi:hypothetical protein
MINEYSGMAYGMRNEFDLKKISLVFIGMTSFRL